MKSRSIFALSAIALLTVLLYSIPRQAAQSDAPNAITTPVKIFIPFAWLSSPLSDMVLIPAGPFPMGCEPNHNHDWACDSLELPLHTVTLDDYRIDKYEVTNGQYRQCVADGSCTLPRNTASWTRSSYFSNPSYANYPVIYVDWYQSAAYCSWAGKRLPSEAEWEKAARGPALRAAPWGDALPTCDLANSSYFGTDYCIGDTSAVGSYPAGASPYGVMDLAGNVWEWVNDWYDPVYYATSPSKNPAGPLSGTAKIIRGSSWYSDAYFLRAATRYIFDPAAYNLSLGFRCAASAPVADKTGD